MGKERFEVAVRPYAPSDRKQVLELARELEAELAERFPDVRVKSEVRSYRDRYLKAGTKYKTFVAEVQGRIVGYLMGYPSLGAPEVDQMYDVLPQTSTWSPPEFYFQIAFVSRPFRNKGVSSALHQAAVAYARGQGHREVYACIAKWNLSELHVIESLGFVRKDLGFRYRLSLKLRE
jgi:GNAT superfamily N-acetyltransferase